MIKEAKDLQEGEEIVITTVQGRPVWAFVEEVGLTPTNKVRIETTKGLFFLNNQARIQVA